MAETPELSIYEKTFAKSNKTDAILVVDGKKLYVNKWLLSYHSDYFKTLFNSDFKEKAMKEIEIEYVDFEDFATVLSLVHEQPIEIIWYKAEGLLQLADRLLLNNAKFQIEMFIKSCTNIPRPEKLLLADEYELTNLLEHTLALYDSKESLEDFSHSDNRNLSDKSKAKIFDKIFENFKTFIR